MPGYAWNKLVHTTCHPNTSEGKNVCKFCINCSNGNKGACFLTVFPLWHSWCCTSLFIQKVMKVVAWRIEKRAWERSSNLHTFLPLHTWPIAAQWASLLKNLQNCWIQVAPLLTLEKHVGDVSILSVNCFPFLWCNDMHQIPSINCYTQKHSECGWVHRCHDQAIQVIKS